MRRNKIIDICRYNRLQQHKKCIAFHEAGHAAAIYLNNKARNLPPIYFQILFNEIRNDKDYDLVIYQENHDDSVARVEGGRLIPLLPYSLDSLMHKLIDDNEIMAPLIKDYLVAFEADVINLLVGPLAEAKYIYNRDDEPFTHRLIGLKALKNYGGGSDLALVREYLESFSANKQQQDEKLNELFSTACGFVGDSTNWMAITKLANYILDSNKNIISYNEVVSVLES